MILTLWYINSNTRLLRVKDAPFMENSRWTNNSTWNILDFFNLKLILA